MSVSNTTVKQVYACNGVITTFAIPFAWLITSQIKVNKIEVATGVVTPLVHVTDFTFSPNDTNPTSIVTVGAPFTAAFQVEVIRETSLTQLVDYINNGSFLAEDHEAALDKIVMMIQELADAQQAAILLNTIDQVAGFERTLPAAVMLGIPRVNADKDGFEFKTIEEIMDEAGFTDQINQALADAAAAQAAATAAAASALAAQTAATNAAASAAAAAASAAAAVGASVSNRIQIPLYAPAFMGGMVEEENDQEIVKLDIGNRVTGYAKMSQYFIPGRPIVLGFCSYSTTFDLTSLYKLLITATLVKNGQEVSTTTNQVMVNDETMVSGVASAQKVHTLQLSADGLINGVAVDPNDGIKLEIKRMDASVPLNEDMALTRILKQTAELSFA